MGFLASRGPVRGPGPNQDQKTETPEAVTFR
jgi:hypothetical protein